MPVKSVVDLSEAKESLPQSHKRNSLEAQARRAYRQSMQEYWVYKRNIVDDQLVMDDIPNIMLLPYSANFTLANVDSGPLAFPPTTFKRFSVKALKDKIATAVQPALSFMWGIFSSLKSNSISYPGVADAIRSHYGPRLRNIYGEQPNGDLYIDNDQFFARERVAGANVHVITRFRTDIPACVGTSPKEWGDAIYDFVTGNPVMTVRPPPGTASSGFEAAEVGIKYDNDPLNPRSTTGELSYRPYMYTFTYKGREEEIPMENVRSVEEAMNERDCTDSDWLNLLPLAKPEEGFPEALSHLIKDQLISALKKDALYITDYRPLRTLHPSQIREQNGYIAPSVVFYHVVESALEPICAYFNPDLTTQEVYAPPLSPADHPGVSRWLMAKTAIQNCEVVFHQFISHLPHCHLAVEPVAMAALRNLSPNHPVWKLLQPHIRYTMSINYLARTKLIYEGGLIEQTVAPGRVGAYALSSMSFTGAYDPISGRKVLATFDYFKHSFRHRFARRGLFDQSKLPYHPFRDSAKVYDVAYTHFTTDFVRTAYGNTTNLYEDFEITAMMHEICGEMVDCTKCTFGLSRINSETTLESFASFLQVVMMIASVAHSGLNYPQLESFGFPPMAPGILRRPFPPPRGSLAPTIKDFLDTLPTIHASMGQWGTMKLLSMLPDPESTFSGYDDLANLYELKDDDLAAVASRFGHALEKKSALLTEIAYDHKYNTIPYPYLLLENMSLSVEI